MSKDKIKGIVTLKQNGRVILQFESTDPEYIEVDDRTIRINLKDQGVTEIEIEFNKEDAKQNKK